MKVNRICPRCMKVVFRTAGTAEVYAELVNDGHWDMQEWHVECQVQERRERTTLDKALAVDRGRYEVGQEVYAHEMQRDQQMQWKILALDWERAAGPIFCELADGLSHFAYFQPWEVAHVPKSVEEIEAYLNS